MVDLRLSTSIVVDFRKMLPVTFEPMTLKMSSKSCEPGSE